MNLFNEEIHPLTHAPEHYQLVQLVSLVYEMQVFTHIVWNCVYTCLKSSMIQQRIQWHGIVNANHFLTN